jgi:predicted small integral membrane protein
VLDLQIRPLLAVGVLLSTALTDAVYVLFTSAVAARRRLAAATWSSCWYLLSAFAVISYTRSWIYVLFAAGGSWLGAYASLTWLRLRDGTPGAGPPPAPTSRA